MFSLREIGSSLVSYVILKLITKILEIGSSLVSYESDSIFVVNYKYESYSNFLDSVVIDYPFHYNCSMLYKCGNGRDGYGYPMEKVDWVAMGESDQATWLSSGIKSLPNTELVRLGIFQGERMSDFIWSILLFSFLIFMFLRLLLDLLAISDNAGNPRTGVRRGELWARLAFNISKAPFPLVCELERMVRGKTL